MLNLIQHHTSYKTSWKHEVFCFIAKMLSFTIVSVFRNNELANGIAKRSFKHEV